MILKGIKSPQSKNRFKGPKQKPSDAIGLKENENGLFGVLANKAILNELQRFKWLIRR